MAANGPRLRPLLSLPRRLCLRLCLASNACQCLVWSASRLRRAPTFALRWLRLDPPTRFRAAKASSCQRYAPGRPCPCTNDMAWPGPVCSGTAARLCVASPRHGPVVFASRPACSVDPATCRARVGSTTVVAAAAAVVFAASVVSTTMLPCAVYGWMRACVWLDMHTRKYTDTWMCSQPDAAMDSHAERERQPAATDGSWLPCSTHQAATARPNQGEASEPGVGAWRQAAMPSTLMLLLSHWQPSGSRLAGPAHVEQCVTWMQALGMSCRRLDNIHTPHMCIHTHTHTHLHEL